jgi:hypothetical protein
MIVMLKGRKKHVLMKEMLVSQAETCKIKQGLQDLNGATKNQEAGYD